MSHLDPHFYTVVGFGQWCDCRCERCVGVGGDCLCKDGCECPLHAEVTS